ncbi:2-Hydroxyacid oxidase 2-like isoform X1 [Rhincodon typus]|uniref:2-Hydroxyacid oxidase 2-like isoform X1 n=1 Tax=Rhincodon typus TaxID=259920 RepID=UPI0020305646|nr:2-Hydroxyacid oxidase 2-like isoform X1 [Rhincodon typus]
MSLVCLSDFEVYAKERLPKTTWDYYAAGADECCTRDDNLMAYKRIRLRPRMLRDVSVTDTRVTIQGMEISFPIGIAPTAFHCMAWHDGEMSTAREIARTEDAGVRVNTVWSWRNTAAAEAMNTCYIASTYSTCSVEEISAAAPNGFRWFQLYVYRNRKLSEQLVHRVEAHGYRAIVLTVDVPYTGKRRNDIRNNFKLPPHLKIKNFDGIFEVWPFPILKMHYEVK